MNDFAKVLYEKFFMRDFMGKLGPGAVFLVMVAYTLRGETLDISRVPTAILWVAGLPFAYLIGLGVQILGELLGLHSATPAPRYILFIPTKFSVNTEFDKRLALIGKAKECEWTVNAKEQRERFLVLKEASGNMSIALLFGSIIAWSGLWGANLSIFYKIACILVAGVLYLSHRIHAIRQANYETKVLREVGLLSEDEANNMRKYKWFT